MMKRWHAVCGVALVAVFVAAYAECNNKYECVNGGFFDLESCGCKCQAPWAGKSCRTCQRSCQNGGELESASCTCVCYGDYAGDYCEKSTNGQLEATPAAGSGSAKSKPKAAVTELNEDQVQVAMQNALTSPHCNGNMYLTCKGETAKDAKGIFLVEEKMKCTRWSTAYRTVELLAIKGAQHGFHRTRDIFDVAQLNNLRNEANADDTIQDTLVTEDGELGFMVCHAPESELLAEPDDNGQTSRVMANSHCTNIMHKGDLARKFTDYVMPHGDNEAAENALFAHDMAISS